MTTHAEVVAGLHTLTNDMKLLDSRQSVRGVQMADGLVEHGQEKLVDRDRCRHVLEVAMMGTGECCRPMGKHENSTVQHMDTDIQTCTKNKYVVVGA